MNTAWVNCSAGVAGDMLLGAFIDAGADPVAVAEILYGLNLDGWALTTDKVIRCGISATHAIVVEHHHVDDDHHHHSDSHGHAPHRPYRDIVKMLNDADLPTRVRERSLAVFRTLGEAEAAVHDTSIDDIEFHEVGSVDAIIDIVGTCAALEVLGVDHLHASAIATAHGNVKAAHGVIPHPGPAVTHMLAAHNVPVRGIDVAYETATPTGVAILCALAESFGSAPSMTVMATGHGAGTKDPADRANVVQVLLGQCEVSNSAEIETLVVLETNTDDVSPEVLAFTVSRLMAAGANDAWVTPIRMKKDRHGHCLQVLCAPHLASSLRDIITAETGTLGIRSSTVDRFAQPRTIVTVDVLGHPIDVKCSESRVKAEFDHAAAAAKASGLPLREVMRLAEDTARARLDDQK
jgi:uncharacterized protein (TIGR00299 family) protein